MGFGLNFSLICYKFSFSTSDGISWFLLGDAVYYACFCLHILIAFNSEPPLLEQDLSPSFSNFKSIINKKDSAYALHRSQVRTSQEYRKNCLNELYFFNLTHKFTQIINDLIGKYILK